MSIVIRHEGKVPSLGMGRNGNIEIFDNPARLAKLRFDSCKLHADSISPQDAK